MGSGEMNKANPKKLTRKKSVLLKTAELAKEVGKELGTHHDANEFEERAKMKQKLNRQESRSMLLRDDDDKDFPSPLTKTDDLTNEIEGEGVDEEGYEIKKKKRR